MFYFVIAARSFLVSLNSVTYYMTCILTVVSYGSPLYSVACLDVTSVTAH